MPSVVCAGYVAIIFGLMAAFAIGIIVYIVGMVFGKKILSPDSAVVEKLFTEQPTPLRTTYLTGLNLWRSPQGWGRALIVDNGSVLLVEFNDETGLHDNLPGGIGTIPEGEPRGFVGGCRMWADYALLMNCTHQ